MQMTIASPTQASAAAMAMMKIGARWPVNEASPASVREKPMKLRLTALSISSTPISRKKMFRRVSVVAMPSANSVAARNWTQSGSMWLMSVLGLDLVRRELRRRLGRRIGAALGQQHRADDGGEQDQAADLEQQPPALPDRGGVEVGPA